MTDIESVRGPHPHESGAWQFAEMTGKEAEAVLGWRYEGQDAFYDTLADPGFAAEFAGFVAFKGSRERCVVGLGLVPALTVYERLGFVETGRVSRAAPELGGETVEFIEMALG